MIVAFAFKDARNHYVNNSDAASDLRFADEWSDELNI